MPLGTNTLVACMLLVLATALRVLQIDRLEMWLDECFTVLAASDPAGVLKALSQDSNAPGFYWIARWWIRLVGVEPGPVRMLSMVFGVLQLGALGWWIARLSGSARAGLWALAIGAVTPIHIYYCQEARGYTWVWLLITMSGWSLSEATRADEGSGRRNFKWWMAYGAVTAAAIWSNDLAVALLPAAWVCLAATGRLRAAWRPVAIAQVAVAVVAAPYFFYAIQQPKAEVAKWIEAIWLATPPLLALPRSLESFLIGGASPYYLRMAMPSTVVRFLAIGFYAIAAAVLVVRIAAHRTEGRTRSACAVLGCYCTTLLLLPYLYSLTVQPIYVVGRYDTFALPAFLGLIGIALAEMQAVLSQRNSRVIAALPTACLVALAFLALAPRYQRSSATDEVTQIQSRRATTLASRVSSSDRVLFLGQEATKIGYQLLRIGRPLQYNTFPSDTALHMGWFNAEDVASRPAGTLRQHAQSTLDRLLSGSSPDARLWLVMDPYSGRPAITDPVVKAHTAISDVLLQELASRSLKMIDPDPAIATLGVRVYSR